MRTELGAYSGSLAVSGVWRYTGGMTKVQLLEREIRKLDRASLRAFRKWFEEYDSAAWDRQIVRDARAGKLKKLACEAAAARKAGKLRAL